jgi:hypothetical protein
MQLKAVQEWAVFFFWEKWPFALFMSKMIHLTKGETNTVILTLTEKQTLTTPNYLFRFVNRTTGAEINFVKTNASDVSQYKYRFNQFSVVTSSYFSNSPSGEWLYYVYEQTSATNKDETKATGMLEQGIMRLNESDAFEYTQHEPENTYITR